jgi:hypothetical protein
MSDVKIKRTTPKGIAVYPWLQKPDTKFKKEGEFRVGLRLNPTDPEVIAWMTEIEEIVDDEVRATTRTLKKGFTVNKRLPWRDDKDDDDQPTGMIVASLHTKAAYLQDGVVVKKTCPIVDAKKAPFKGGTIGSGSTLKIVHEIKTYSKSDSDGKPFQNVGVSLYIRTVQVLDLVEFSVDLDGLEEEDGYTSDDSDATPTTTTTTTGGTTEGFE